MKRRDLMQGGMAAAGSALTASLASIASIASAQTAWPTKPIRLIIAFAPGGPTDLVSRVIAQRLSEQLGQPVVVENKPGAGGNLAAELAAKATPDGYTFFYNTSAVVIGPSLYAKVNYDPLKDFTPVSLTAAVPLMLVVNSALPVKTVQEFVAYAKSKQGQLNYASSGTGTITHLAGVMFAKELGIDATHVPYKGSNPALLDVATGSVQFMIDTINSTLPLIRDGKLRPLATATSKRSSVLPDVPTFSETVLPGFEMSAWQGVVAPTGTPSAITQKLNDELNKALRHSDVRSKLAVQGAEPLGSTANEYGAYLKSELGRWGKVVRDSGAKAE
jgi:tripartite-type tricarboxylate transporter receptor subunit TctC